MKKERKKSTLLFMAMMFAVLGINLSNNEVLADDNKEVITERQIINEKTVTNYEYKIFKVPASGEVNVGGALQVEKNADLTVLSSDFIENASGLGGAIFQKEDSITKIVDSTFKGNKSVSGGAIYNVGKVIILNSKFINNSADFEGGAIYNDGDIIITAETDDVIFTGNTSSIGKNAIYCVGGTIDISSVGEEHKVIFNDGIKSYGDVINISGVVDINNTIDTTENGNVNLNEGVLHLGSNTQNGTTYVGGFSEKTNLCINGGVIDTIDNEVREHVLGTVYGNKLKLSFDVNFDTQQNDIFKFNVGDSSNPTTVYINDINLVDGVYAQEGFGTIKILEGNIDNVKLNNFAMFEDDSKIIFTESLLKGAYEYIASGDGGLIAAVAYDGGDRQYNVSGEETVNKSLGIMGGDGSTLTIKGMNNNPDIDIVNGNEQSYGGIDLQNETQTLTVKNVGFKNFKEGVICITNGKANVIGSNFENNSRSYGEGGAILNNNNLIVTSSTFKNNSIGLGLGGAISNSVEDSLLSVSNSEFSNNSAAAGGAIHSYGITTISNSTFKNNYASEAGGAILLNTSGEITVKNSDFDSNSASRGGAILNVYNIDVIGSNFNENKADIEGGAICNSSQGVVNINEKSSSFNNNSAGLKGGAIYNDGGMVNITGATFKENFSEGWGGAIFNDGNSAGSQTAIIKDTIFVNNSALKEGGAIFNQIGTVLEVSDSIFINNSAVSGGAIYNEGDAIISNSTFSGNMAKYVKNDIFNEGSLKLEGSVKLDGGIVSGGSIGKTEILSNAIVDNSNGQLIQKEVSVGTDAFLTTDLSKMAITDGITNDGTVTLAGAGKFTDKTKFTGNGSIVLDVEDGIFTLNDKSLIANTVNIKVNQGIFKIGAADTGSYEYFYNKLSFNDGTTLDLMNDNGMDLIDNLNILGSNSEVKLMLDFGDNLGGLSIESSDSSIVLEKINLNTITNTTETYFLAYRNGNIIDLALDAEIIDDNNNFNYVTLTKIPCESSYSAELQASKINLNQAVQTQHRGQRIYQMNESEKVESNSTNPITGVLVVNGNGNTISSSEAKYGSIIIGDAVDNSELSLVDANIDNFKLQDTDKGAFTVKNGGNLSIIAKNNDVTIKNITGGEGNAIYLDSSIGNANVDIFAKNSERKITIDNDIRSNSNDNTINLGGDGKIVLNGVLDPVTVVQQAQNVYRNNYDEAVNWNLNGGTVHYSNDKYLYDSTYHDDSKLNIINLNGGSLDLMNGVASDIKLANLQVAAKSNLYLDVDLANEKMDRFSDDTHATASANINVAGLNLISDAVKDYTSINFTNNDNLKGRVSYTGSQGLTALSPIYKYNVDYDNTTGNFGFTRVGSGYSGHNPSIYAGAVGAQVGSYLGQLNVYEQSFANMDLLMLMSKEQRTAMKYANKYATSTNNLIYDGTNQIPEQAKGAWFRPYATFENVGLKGGVDVGNVAYGSLFGGDTNLIDLGHGWDAVITPFAGYLGSHQTYDGVGIYQNGGVLGLSSAFYKGNFFTGLTANAGANVGEASTMYGTDTFTMLTAGIASKTGYNWELAKGKFIIQPSFLMSYTFVNTFDYKTASGVNMNSDPIHGIQIAPGLKFIGNLKNGWQPYVGIQMVWNIMDKTRFQANDVSLEQLSVKPYIQYGLGVQKRWGERFTGYAQAMIRNGGRNGIALSAGFRWALGKKSETTSTKEKKALVLPKTNLKLSSLNK